MATTAPSWPAVPEDRAHDAMTQAGALTRLTPFDGAAAFTIRGLGTMGRLLSFGMIGRARRAQFRRMKMAPPDVDPGDPPWCARDSASWIIHGDASFPVGGVLALWTQSLHPLALAGVIEHSDFEEHPIRRAIRTGRFVYTTTFSPGSEAETLCAQVRAVHRRVEGIAPDGRRYAAGDAELVDWIHCALLLSIARTWLVYGDRPDPALLDSYVAEQARVPLELGDPSPPRDWAGLLDRLDEHRRSLTVNEQTRWIGDWLARPALPGSLRVAMPAYKMLHALAVAAAPGWVRAMWGSNMPVLPVR
ncbi:MAG: oxygenase MpaB family protein, partial [Acidimicrobiales bacterium]